MTSRLESSLNEVTDSDVLEVKLLKKVLSAMDKEVLPSLEVLTGVAEGKKFILAEDFEEGLIGRDPGVDFSIEEYVISRRHAKLERRDDGFYVKDIGSKNGTFVNHRPVSEARLSDGDRIALGTIVLLYRNPKEVDFEAINKAKTARRAAAVPRVELPEEPSPEVETVDDSVGELPDQPLGFPATEDNPAEEDLSETGSAPSELDAGNEVDNYPAPHAPPGFSSLELGLMAIAVLVFAVATIAIVRIVMSS